ncbi:thermonuclease family protein [Calidifontibacter terrae]
MPSSTLRFRPAIRLALPALLALGLAGCGPVASDASRVTTAVEQTAAGHTGDQAGDQTSAGQASETGQAGQSSTTQSSTTRGGQASDSKPSTTTTGAEPQQTDNTANDAAAQPSSWSVASSAASSGTLYRVAGITDGDTIKVWIGSTKETIRLLGVDTPESKKPQTAVACYAQQATSKMQSLVQSKNVRLVADTTQADRDKYGRLIRYVVLPDGRDVSQELIAGGFGREYTYDAAYAKQGTFRSAQSQAQSAKRGLWGSCSYAAAFKPPSTSTAPTTSAPKPSPPVIAAPTPPAKSTKPAQVAGQCLIKGNISKSGEKIYHVPGQRHYADTVITPSKGERMFCSEQEAQNAGWRRSKV